MTKILEIEILEIEICLLFGVWDLEFIYGERKK